jgi:hypothetical protein
MFNKHASVLVCKTFTIHFNAEDERPISQMDFSPYKLGLTMTNPYPGKNLKMANNGDWRVNIPGKKKNIFKQNIT